MLISEIEKVQRDEKLNAARQTNPHQKAGSLGSSPVGSTRISPLDLQSSGTPSITAESLTTGSLEKASGSPPPLPELPRLASVDSISSTDSFGMMLKTLDSWNPSCSREFFYYIYL